MISYVIGLVAVLAFFSNPISQLLYPDLARRQNVVHPRPTFNESLLAMDAPNATAPKCPPDTYRARILSRSPLVVYLESFLSDEERHHLLNVSNPLFEPSTITHDGVATHRDTSVRDSHVAAVPRSDTVRCIERRALALQGWPSDLFVERLRTQRYTTGGHYGYHFDWRVNVNGWGRVSSIMAWVNGSDGLRGGGTEFPLLPRPEGETEWCKFVECERKQEGGEEQQQDGEKEGGEEHNHGVVFKVVPGNAVYWENFARDGRGYEDTWHAGLPVDEGVKVGLNIWSYGRIR
ncbi:hypothetical protein QQX98_006742 [Neonectria punicea]|uniref:Prolyl 4-hydroxylase alpha subunit domain-containing protein n=1 Tax=Neonectria punicea TaxID=979145 RepID=A0ABR1H0G5_9HYPO